MGNEPSTANVFWSIVSILLLIAGIGFLVWYKAFTDRHDDEEAAPKKDPLEGVTLTPSMRAIPKYAYIVVALFCVQVLLGAVVAHYTVEGKAFFGFPLAEYLPVFLGQNLALANRHVLDRDGLLGDWAFPGTHHRG